MPNRSYTVTIANFLTCVTSVDKITLRHMAKQRQLAVAFLFSFFVLRGCHLASQVTAAMWWLPLLEVALDGEGHLTATWRSLRHRGKSNTYGSA